MIGTGDHGVALDRRRDGEIENRPGSNIPVSTGHAPNSNRGLAGQGDEDLDMLVVSILRHDGDVRMPVRRAGKAGPRVPAAPTAPQFDR